jgi:Bacterial capsule synthesis protein PGA_cap
MKVRFEDLPIVKAYALKGKILVKILRGLLWVLHIFMGKAWQRAPQYFHDDPRLYNIWDILFFAYKYYFKSPLEDDAGGKIEAFIRENPPVFNHENIKIDSEITLHAGGDLMPYEWIQPQFCKHLWDDIGDDFFNADIRFANFETPINLSKPASLVPEVMLNDMNFNGDKEMFSLFNPKDNTPSRSNRNFVPQQYFHDKYQKKWSFDVLSTANNHSLDMGEEGVFTTIDFLEKQGIKHVGTSKTKENRLDFPIIEQNGIKIAFIAYTFSMNQMTNPEGKEWLVNHLEVNQSDVDLSPLKNDILYAREVKKADFVVLSLHYGNAYQPYTGAHIFENTKRIFDTCGCDVILGGHAHNVQPAMRYDFVCPMTFKKKQGFVLFSFSDFVAYDIFNWCHLSVYLKLRIGKGKNIERSEIPNPFGTEGVSETVLLESVMKPVYACGVYQDENNRDLRLLDAEKWLEKIEKEGKPDFMTDWNVRELEGLMDFYRRKIIFK